MSDLTRSFLITKSDGDLRRDMIANLPELVGLKQGESGDKYFLPGGGNMSIRQHTPASGYGKATLGDFLQGHILLGRPKSAAAWVQDYLKGCSSVIEFGANATNQSSQNAAEAIRSSIWKELGGIWYFENEWFTNESAAAVLLEVHGGTAGKLTVATLYKGAWVEYGLYASNPTYMARFLSGELPTGLR